MNEEINRREAELNDAALSGVSGGASDDSDRRRAEVICGSCPAKSQGNSPFRCEGGAAALAEYIERNGALRTWDECPFLKRNGQGR